MPLCHILVLFDVKVHQSLMYALEVDLIVELYLLGLQKRQLDAFGELGKLVDTRGEFDYI